MKRDRIEEAALSHIDRGDPLPFVFRGLSREDAGDLFYSVLRKRPGMLDIPIDQGIRSGLSRLFGKGDRPDGFRDAWIAFTISVGIRGRSPGMEAAAGLQQHRDAIGEYLSSGEATAETAEALCRLLDAIARFMPAVLVAPAVDELDDFTSELFTTLAGCDNLRCPPMLGALVSGSAPFPAKLVDVSVREEERSPEVPEELLGLVRAAAVLGYIFDPAEASALSGCVKNPGPLIESGLWHAVRPGLHRFASREDRNRFLDSLDPFESQRLHSGAALLVLERAGGLPDALRLAGDLFLRSGDAVSAGASYLEAAVHSGGVSHQRAARLWGLAAAHCPGEFSQAQLNRSQRLFKGGFLEQALEAAGLAAGNLEVPAGLLMLEILIHMGFEPRAKALEALLDGKRMEGLFDPQQTAELAILSFVLLRRNAMPSEVRLEVDRLEAVGLSDRQRCRLELVEARAMARHGMLAEALEAAGKARDMALGHGFTWLSESCSIFIVSCLRKAGRLKEAAEGCDGLMKSAARTGNLEALIYALNTRGGIASSMCSFNEAARCYDNVGRLAGRIGNHRLATTAAANLGVARMMQGKYDEALDIFMNAIRMASEVGDAMRLAATYGNMARIFLDLNRPDNAEDCVETMLDLVRRSGPDNLLESTLYLRARVLDLKGRCDDALVMLDEASGMAAKAGRTRNAGLYMLYRGLFLMNGGRIEEAAEALAEAALQSASIDQPANAEAARVCGTACLAMLGREHPDSLLAQSGGSMLRSVRGTAGYWHWKLTGASESARTALEYLAPAKGENNAYRAHEMMSEIRESAAGYQPAGEPGG